MSVVQGSRVWGVRPNHPGDDDWFAFSVGDQIGAAGGAGSVHRLGPDTDPPLVGKFYNDALRTQLKSDKRYSQRIIVTALNRDELSDALPFAMWPRRVLFDARDPPSARLQEHVIGFTMPMLVGTTSLHDLIHHEKSRVRLTPQATLHVAATLAHQLAKLHRHPWGFVFGDMSPQNIHVSHDHAEVRFIDTDSFQFEYNNGAYAFLLPGLTPTFKSPGAQKAIIANGRVSATHDDFVLAILIFMMLMADLGYTGLHPFQSLDSDEDELIERRAFPYDNPSVHRVNPSVLAAYQTLPEGIRDAFSQTFTATPPVSAKSWTTLLSDQRRVLWRS